jgi:hypothetical protein
MPSTATGADGEKDYDCKRNPLHIRFDATPGSEVPDLEDAVLAAPIPGSLTLFVRCESGDVFT